MPRSSLTAVAGGSRPLVAVVDSDSQVLGWLQEALSREGFQPVPIQLTDFDSGAGTLALLDSQGVQVIIYDLGPFYQQNRDRFEELCAAVTERGTPFIITSILHWVLEEEAMSEVAGFDGGRRPATLARVVSAVRRALERPLWRSAGAPDELNGLV